MNEDTVSVVTDPCQSCGTPRSDFPMCFRGDVYCSDNCRKALGLGSKDAFNGRA